MDRCNPFLGGIFVIRSNIPLNHCQNDKRVQAITSRFSNYKLAKQEDGKYLLTNLTSEMRTNVQTSESYYPQFIFTKVTMELIGQSVVEKSPNTNENQKKIFSELTYVVPTKEATGGRKPKTPDQVVRKTLKLLTELADSLDQESNFSEPYLEIMSEIIRLIETMDYDILKVIIWNKFG